ncbi:cation transporter [Candidatus Bathyarchaeota archaeon]|nr:cation transporter [Candidatus Bathyarchaeota archaeon]
MRKKQAAIIAILCGIVIFFLKMAAFFVSNSVALLSDALESIINIMASGLMFFSISISERDPDQNHEYGHQKIEDISCLLEGVLVIMAALFIINTAISRISSPNYLLELNLGIVISIFATGINLSVSFILLRTAKKTGSAALEGDSKHLMSDVISSIGVWIGLIFSQLTSLTFIDSLLAFMVAIFVMKIGFDLIFKSSHSLMDSSCVNEEKMITTILRRHKYRFIDFHDLKTRRSGNCVFAELHLSVNSSLTIKEAHDLTDHLENEVKKTCSKINLIIHVEPRDPPT